MKNFKNQTGQIVIIMLLIMVVTLGIGLSVIGRSTTEISTATKTENSSRAFSAAEAGIETAFIQTFDNSYSGEVNLSNQSSANVDAVRIPLAATPQKAIEYPPFGKDSFAQFWLADPTTAAVSYRNNNFDIYFGDPTPDGDSTYYVSHPDDKPAIEVRVVYWDGTQYKSHFEVRDSYNGTNSGRDGFDVGGCDEVDAVTKTNNSEEEKEFYCRVTINSSGATTFYSGDTVFPILVRVRLLLSGKSHPVAIKATGSATLPLQAKLLTSKGESGGVQRTIEVFQEENVLPHFFDYALFSASSVSR